MEDGVGDGFGSGLGVGVRKRRRGLRGCAKIEGGGGVSGREEGRVLWARVAVQDEGCVVLGRGRTVQVGFLGKRKRLTHIGL